jgi:protoporphyrin/coproporphyrin ferrochelatase
VKKTAVLLIGFGGPRNMGEVAPFLKSVTGGTKIPEARLKEVFHHYELIGGKSRFNEVTELQRKALEKELHARGLGIAVGAAYRHSTPTFEDAFEQFKRFGVERVIGLILASFQSFASRGKYIEKVEEARASAGAQAIELLYTSSFDLDPLFLEAQSDRVREVWNGPYEGTAVLFTAHSIPSGMCEESAPQNGGRCYGFQFHQASSRIASRLAAPVWRSCYQSRSGNPKEPWLEPDIADVIKTFDVPPAKGVLLVPVGFLCDNVEVVYDLDIEAKQAAEAKGLEFRRAGTVGDHPKFIKMMAEKVLERVS